MCTGLFSLQTLSIFRPTGASLTRQINHLWVSLILFHFLIMTTIRTNFFAEFSLKYQSKKLCLFYIYLIPLRIVCSGVIIMQIASLGWHTIYLRCIQLFKVIPSEPHLHIKLLRHKISPMVSRLLDLKGGAASGANSNGAAAGGN